MTREEAIRELSYIADEMPSMECGDWKEAICMAIKALEQEPCDDTISRQAVLDIAKSSKSNWIDNSVLFKRVNALPPVTPQPKTGHWIAVHPLQPNDGGDYMCSVCRCGGLTYKPTKFCPNCGAKMESKDKG